MVIGWNPRRLDVTRKQLGGGDDRPVSHEAQVFVAK